MIAVSLSYVPRAVAACLASISAGMHYSTMYSIALLLPWVSRSLVPGICCLISSLDLKIRII